MEDAMPLKGFRCKKPYEILSKEEVEMIHQGSLEVLSETGMTVAHEQSRKILEEGGCTVDREKHLVKFPTEIVEWAIAQCPHSFLVRARNPEFTLNLGADAVYFASFP